MGDFWGWGEPPAQRVFQGITLLMEQQRQSGVDSRISVERRTGWFHDLYFPGYLWADTAGRWLVPGMNYHDGMASYDIQHDRLVAAMNELQRQETAPGQWGLGGTRLPFGEQLQQLFPVVGRFLDENGRPAISQLSPDRVERAFAGVFLIESLFAKSTPAGNAVTTIAIFRQMPCKCRVVTR